MSIRKISFIFSAVALCALTASIANAAIIAGWDQNSNANPLAPTGFGFEAADERRIMVKRYDITWRDPALIKE